MSKIVCQHALSVFIYLKKGGVVMKVMVFGGTGMLGYEAALELLNRGHTVEAVARHDVKMSPQFDKNVKLNIVDLFQQSDEQLMELLVGMDALVYGVGLDERTPHDAPAQKKLHFSLVQKVNRMLRVARRAGVKRTVILGSYFVTFQRQHPEWCLAEHHPYIHARVLQSEQAIAVGHEENSLSPMDVMMLEIPYVFGSTPHRVPLWKTQLFDMILNADQVVAYYKTGGTAAITAKQAGQAIAGALEQGEHGQCYPIGDMNLTWQELIQIVLDTFELQKEIVELPLDTAIQYASMQIEDMKAKGKEFGLDYLKIHEDIMLRHLYLDKDSYYEKFGIQSGGVVEAIRESVRASYPERFST